MNDTMRRLNLSARNFARDNSIISAILGVLVFLCATLVLIDTFWAQIQSLHVPRLVGYAIGWFIATATTLCIALFLMWVADRREVDRSRRAIRLNFDHAITAMLDLAKKFTSTTDRNLIGAAIECAQKQIIAASARLKRFENKLTSFPPTALNAYAELENEIDITLEDLNELHRKLRIDRESRFPKFGFEVMDRLMRFNDYLGCIHSRQTVASLAIKQFEGRQDEGISETPTAIEDSPISIRRA